MILVSLILFIPLAPKQLLNSCGNYSQLKANLDTLIFHGIEGKLGYTHIHFNPIQSG
jgi:hypothetical protein